MSSQWTWTFGKPGKAPSTISSMLGCMAAVRATESPSQPSPEFNHNLGTTGPSSVGISYLPDGRLLLAGRGTPCTSRAARCGTRRAARSGVDWRLEVRMGARRERRPVSHRATGRDTHVHRGSCSPPPRIWRLHGVAHCRATGSERLPRPGGPPGGAALNLGLVTL